MTWRNRITTNPEVLTGKPVIKGTRLSVEHILGLLAAGSTEEEILQSYPHLEREDVRACLQYAREVIGIEKVFATPDR